MLIRLRQRRKRDPGIVLQRQLASVRAPKVQHPRSRLGAVTSSTYHISQNCNHEECRLGISRPRLSTLLEYPKMYGLVTRNGKY